MEMKVMISLLCVALLSFLVWLGGVVFEFEYPYAMTLSQVRRAVSVGGAPVSQIMQRQGYDMSRLHWHTCSYCNDPLRGQRNIILVRLDVADKTNSFYFAYCRPTHVLVPMMAPTAAEFPSLMPPGDEMRSVGELDGSGSRWSLGQGDLVLPRNWYRKATGTVPGGQ